MNIFVTSHTTDQCAVMLDDKRLVKMVLETAQMLSTTMHIHGKVGPYRATHRNHPCTQWVAATGGNYLWAISLLEELSKEYTYRYERVHKCAGLLPTFRHHINYHPDISKGRTPFANCTPFKDTQDTLSAYRKYMTQKWNADRNPKWTKRKPPDWYNILTL